MAGTSATLLARKWESALLVNVDNDTLRRVLDNPEAWPQSNASRAGARWATTSSRPSSTESEKVKELKNKAKDKELTEKQKKKLSDAGEGIQVQAQTRAGEADQVRDAHSCVYVPDRFS